MKQFYYRFLFVSILIVGVSLPLIQMTHKIKFIPNLKLNGVENLVLKPKFSFDSIKTGEYQQLFDKWFSQNFGLKNYILKTNNQINYSFFNQTPANSNILVGKKGYLYEGSYTSEYLNFIPPLGSDLLETKVKEMKELQDILKKQNKYFMLLITPSKAAIYPENIPDRLKQLQTNKVRNYDLIIPLLNKYGINYIDGHKISSDNKLSGKYNMFPIGGTHWNYLAAYYTTKEAIQKMEEISGKDMVNIDLKKIEETPPIGTDRDLADLLNVWKPHVNYKSPKPIITESEPAVKFVPKIFIEGGSFSEQFINTLHSSHVFSKLDLYFYFHTHIQFIDKNPSGSVIGEIQKADWDNDVFNSDVIIIEMNEQNIPKLKEGFLQAALTQLNPNKEETKLTFKNINKDFVEAIQIDDKSGFKIKKGANGTGTVFFETENMKLEQNKKYTISYKASGFNQLNTDLFPDELPQYNNVKISDVVQDFSYTFISNSSNMNNASLRFFIDGLNKTVDKDLIVYDIKFIPTN